jgi:superfamily II DNA/RNA helicase
LELISMKRWISAKRISYVVLDEADHMLSTGWDVGMLGC